MAASKNQAEQATRDGAGRFLPGVSGNPSGRPAGASNRLLAMARAAAEEIFPLVVEQARAGDMDAARLVLSIGVPRGKPLNPPLDCLADLPLPERPKDLGRTAAFLLEQVAAGKLSTADAESVLSLAKRSVDLQQAARPISLDDFRL